MPASVPDIPRIMRAKGWSVGARLMDHWFGGAAATSPPFVNRNDSIVTMKWALSFPRAAKVYRQIINDRIWSNERARPIVKTMLKRSGVLNSNGACFGVFQSTQPVIHGNAVNFRTVEQSAFAAFDDMAAALANFNFHVQIGGEVRPVAGGRHRVTVNMVGIYIRDQYDFNGPQELGFWDAATTEVRHTPWFDFTRMTNESFRTWRATSGRGGDFEVFSDVSIVPLTAPDVFEI